MVNHDGPVVLVTGGCGYLGSQLLRDLAVDEQMHGVTIRILDNMQRGQYNALFDLPSSGRYQFIEGDILNPSILQFALRGVQRVVHLAAIVSTPMGFERPIWLEQVNHWGTSRLLEASLDAGVEQFIYASSTAVYGPGGPYGESDPCRPIGPYAMSKHQAEESVLITGTRGMNTAILRFGTLFGYAPSIRFQAVANRFTYLAGVGRPLTVNGSGEQRRPVIHVKDASDAIRFCLMQPTLCRDQILNVVNENISIVELAEVVQSVLPQTDIHYTAQNVLTHFSFEVDSSTFRALGWTPKVSIDAGIADLLARFRNRSPISVEE